MTAHALLGGVLAEMNGGSITGGATGALTSELAAPVIAELLFNKKISDFDADEKAQLSQLSTLAGGLAGGLTSDSVAGGISGSQTAKNAVENKAMNVPNFGTGMNSWGQGALSLAKSLDESGVSPEELTAALSRYNKGDHPDGQNPARELLIAWGNIVGVPVDILWSNEQMTVEKAAEILSSGIPASEAKIVQYLAEKTYLAFVKSGKKIPQWDEGKIEYSFKNSKLPSNPTSQSSSGIWKSSDSKLYVDGAISNTKAKEIINTPHGQRPDPSTYMSKAEIDAHLAKFDDGAIRFTSKSKYDQYGTYGTSDAFVMPKSDFERVMRESKGDLRVVEQKLGLDKGYLSGSDTLIVHVEKKDITGLKVPSGNEGGVNSHWLPGGIHLVVLQRRL